MSKFTLREFLARTPDSEYDGDENPQNSDIWLPDRSSNSIIPPHTVNKVIKALCFDKFKSLCMFQGIHRGITLFYEFVSDLYNTNYRMHKAIMRCSTDDWDEFIQDMVWKYIAIRMVEIDFLFDKNGCLVNTLSDGVRLHEYCLPEEYCLPKMPPPEPLIMIRTNGFSSYRVYDCDYDSYDEWSNDEDTFVDTGRISKNNCGKPLMVLYEEERSDEEIARRDDDHYTDYTNDIDYLEMPEIECWSYFDQNGNEIAPP